MSTPVIKQDMPPKGGYKPINFLRIPAKSYLNSYAMFGGLTAMIFGSAYLWSINYRKNVMLSTEERSARMAMLPFLYAERDRAYLKQLRKNRDEEARLMANVPGWEVGTYYGEPIFKGRPKDYWHDVTINEYFAHASDLDANHYVHIHLYH